MTAFWKERRTIVKKETNEWEEVSEFIQSAQRKRSGNMMKKNLLIGFNVFHKLLF